MEINKKENLVMTLIGEILEIGVSKLSPETAFVDLEGWDSLAHLQIIGEFEDRFHVNIPLERIKDITRIKELMDYLD
jgi:acyl carrier protein